MRSRFYEAAFVQNQNPIGAVNGGQAVGDDEGRASPHQPFERFLD
jgi:hypothetical protein